MTGRAVLTAASAGLVRRHLVQTVVICSVLTVGAAAGILGLTLATGSNALFLGAFTRQHGSDLAVTVNTAKVTPAQLASTRHLPGVTQAGGPYPEATVFFKNAGISTPQPGSSPASQRRHGHQTITLPGLGSPGSSAPAQSPAGGKVPPGAVSPFQGSSVVGRASMGGPLDNLTLMQGRWATRLGEIVVDPSEMNAPAPIGSTLTVTSAPGTPKLVAGYRRIGVLKSIGFTPAQVAAVYLAQIGAPALGGATAGTILGNYWVLPLVNTARNQFGLTVAVPQNIRSAAAPSATFTPSQDKAVTAALHAQPETLSYVAEADSTASVPGVGAHVPLTAYQGNAAALGWDMVSGTWYHGSGQVVVNTADPATAGLSIGQTLHMTAAGKPVTARITGEVFVPAPIGAALFTDWKTLGGKASGLAISQYWAISRPGIRPSAYQSAPHRALGPSYAVTIFVPGENAGVGFFGLVDTSLIGLLTVLVAVLAGLGVLNAVLMATRERVHDLGVFKAVGMTPARPSPWSPAGSSRRPSPPRSSPCPPGWACRMRSCTPSAASKRPTRARPRVASCTSTP